MKDYIYNENSSYLRYPTRIFWAAKFLNLILNTTLSLSQPIAYWWWMLLEPEVDAHIPSKAVILGHMTCLETSSLSL